MTGSDYLQEILKGQTIASDGPELTELRARRAEVDDLLKKHFDGSNPTIRYGGSKAKNTMIREAFDLDIICYFPRDDDEAGKSLKEIYEETSAALGKKYSIQPKGVALRISGASGNSKDVDFHIDVVPGRFIDDAKEDAFLYMPKGDKERLKTNLDTHINQVKGSGVTDTIRLLKLWRVRNGLTKVKTFAIELIVIDLLKGKKSSSLENQLTHVMKGLRDSIADISIKDPANPEGNDLSDLLNEEIRNALSETAKRTMRSINDENWEEVFGPTKLLGQDEKKAALGRVAVTVTAPTKPWCAG